MYGFAEGSTLKAYFMNPKAWKSQMKRTNVNLDCGPRHLSLLQKTLPEAI